MIFRYVHSFALLIFIASCTKPAIEPDAPEMASEFTFTMAAPFTAEPDVTEDVVYLFSSVPQAETTEVVKVNYRTSAVEQRVFLPFFAGEYTVDLGVFEGERELYIGSKGTIFILDGSTLAVKDSITAYVEADAVGGQMHSLEYMAPNLLFTSWHGSHDPGTRSFDRRTGAMISETSFSDHCARVVASRREDGTVELIGIGEASSRPAYIYDVFDENGTLLENNSEFFRPDGMSARLVVTNGAADYFVSGSGGRLFRKNPVRQAGQLDGFDEEAMRDCFLNDAADSIFTLTSNRLRVHAHPSGSTVLERATPGDAKFAFRDDNEVIVICFDQDDSVPVQTIRLDISELR